MQTDPRKEMIDKVMIQLRSRLLADSGIVAGGTFKFEGFVKHGGLAGDVVVTRHIAPNPQDAKPRQ